MVLKLITSEGIRYIDYIQDLRVIDPASELWDEEIETLGLSDGDDIPSVILMFTTDHLQRYYLYDGEEYSVS